jgi:hypothetical protein
LYPRGPTHEHMSSLDASAVVQAFSAGSAQLSAVLRANVSAWVHWRAPGSSSAAARRSLLHVAAFHGAVEAARFLIRAGADPNAVSPDDKATPLHSVCGGRPESLSEVLAVLLEAGADRELRDSLGRKPVDLLLSQVRGQVGAGHDPTDLLRLVCVPSPALLGTRMVHSVCTLLNPLPSWPSALLDSSALASLALPGAVGHARRSWLSHQRLCCSPAPAAMPWHCPRSPQSPGLSAPVLPRFPLPSAAATPGA